MFDFAIIGSGVSGGRISLELVQGGANCVLIEAGREFSAKTFPNNEMDYSTQMFWGGGLEISSDGRLGFLRAKCLGGTSIVNQALLDRFDELAWSDWRQRSGISFLNEKEMEPHYEHCEKSLSVSEIPRQDFNRNAHIFTQAFDKTGHKWHALHRAQGDCKLDQGSDCIVCLGGCPRNSKQSSLVTAIKWAREKGLKVESEFEVDHIDYSAKEIKVVGTQRGERREIKARRAVLAAGALGNTSILIRSGFDKKLPALGESFCCHPQYMTYALFDEPVDSHKGAFQAVASHDPKLRQSGFKLENVFAPPIGTAMLIPAYGHSHMSAMKKYRYMASMEVAIRDEPTGKVSVASNGKIKIDKRLSAQDKNRSKKGLVFVKELFEAAGAKEIIQCTDGFGLHLMGGCVLGTDGANSVTSPDFSIHDHPGLFAADSSVFPAAPGINPSFTVMALAHRASQAILKEGAK